MVYAELSAKGKRHNAEAITVKRIMGEGSYGQVPTSCQCSIAAGLLHTAQVAAEAAYPQIFAEALAMALLSSAAFRSQACCAGL